MKPEKTDISEQLADQLKWLKALDASIIKWQGIAYKGKQESDCPLCNRDQPCSSCPLGKVGPDCYQSEAAYMHWGRLTAEHDNRKVQDQASQAAANRVLADLYQARRQLIQELLELRQKGESR